MITVEKAIQLIETSVKQTTKTDTVPVVDALHCYLSEDIISPINMPPFRQSAMDGYALNLQDSNNYTVIGEIKAGDANNPTLKPGEAVRIFTGAAVPDTANSVVMQERVVRSENNLTIEIASKVGSNIRKKGEQVAKGQSALKKGTKITAAAIGYLSSLGISEVTVFQQPSIAIVTTGNELISAGESLTRGKIYESNSNMLFTALKQLHLEKVSIHKVIDDYQSTLSTLKEVTSENDITLVSGGISVGDYDFVGKALEEIGTTSIFYKVKQKPGKPLFFGKHKENLVFALPGNPASALSCFYVYVQTALKKWQGAADFQLSKLPATVNSSFLKKGDRAQFLKASLKNGKVEILEGQSSAMQQTFALANALIYVPIEQEEINIGDTVEVICLPV